MARANDLFAVLRQANQIANRHAAKLLGLGQRAVVLRNWRLLQRDKAFLAQRRELVPVPPRLATVTQYFRLRGWAAS